MKITHYIPVEIVDLIADYHDYDKYCKPKHQEKFKEVINDIGNMASIMPIINPVLVWQCWGPGAKHLENMVDVLYDDDFDDDIEWVDSIESIEGMYQIYYDN